MLQEITPAELSSPDINGHAATTPHSGQELLRGRRDSGHWVTAGKVVSASRVMRGLSRENAVENAEQSVKAMRAATKASNLSVRRSRHPCTLAPLRFLTRALRCGSTTRTA